MVTRKLTELAVDPENRRKHPARNLEAIAGSLRRWGQQRPIVIDKNNVVRVGNGTFLAAESLGWESIWCVVSELDEPNLTAYAIADNRTAELAEWDYERLAASLKTPDIAAMASDMGFTEAEIHDLCAVDFVPQTADEALKEESDVAAIKVTRAAKERFGQVVKQLQAVRPDWTEADCFSELINEEWIARVVEFLQNTANK